MYRSLIVTASLCFMTCLCAAQNRWFHRGGSFVLQTPTGDLELTPMGAHTLRVRFGAPFALDSVHDYAVTGPRAPVPFAVKEQDKDIILTTAAYSVHIAGRHIRLFDPAGRLLLRELPDTDTRPSVCFRLPATEALYGLGQFRDGALNLRGRTRELVQVNTQVALPVLVSTGGWGIFWDNPSRTVFKDDGQGMRFVSDYGACTAYYLFVGDRLDTLVSAYRELTGQVPLLPRWAFGYHQSRNRYASQQEVQNTAARMAQEKIPFSSIFIDYHYWGKYGTGSHHFDETQFPDVRGMIDTLHDRWHTHVIATVWPSFKPGSPNYDIMNRRHFLLPGTRALDGEVYDVFNPAAAAQYWNLVAQQLVPTGLDGWFLDGPEPDDVNSFLKSMTYLGPADHIRNLFPLFHTTNFYNGLLKAQPDRRPYIITRSAWASQQKNGTVVWSGDIGTTFKELKTQIAAGLDFSASGMPYWTTDIGGYSGGNPQDPAYRELYTRWWEYGVFCPIFRSHGRRYPGDTHGSNELWAFGPATQAVCTRYDEFRYRLMPYIYSLSSMVARNGYTPMRLLAFDFPQDPTSLAVTGEFMYGPAFLVSPVTDSAAVTQTLYLPAQTSWIDFWTGKTLPGGRSVTVSAPLDRIPLFVRAGSIVPLQHGSRDTLDIRIYPGANGFFTLYEDDGLSNRYLRGEWSTIPLAWSDRSKTLTLGPRTGAFPGMPAIRVFRVTVVTPAAGAGMKPATHAREVVYDGAPQAILM